MVDIIPINTVAPARIERLLDHAFGPDRHARTAYRVRGDAAALPDVSFAASEDGTLVGSIQCWPVCFTSDDGHDTPLVMLGPVAVEPTRQRGGLGRALVERALAAAGPQAPLTLIGDPEYYGRFFGFTAECTGEWRLPGPVERRRLLARGAGIPAGPGVLGPRVTAPA